jgi:hypothetical protein
MGWEYVAFGHNIEWTKWVGAYVVEGLCLEKDKKGYV